MGSLLMLIGYGWAALGVWLFIDDTNWGVLLDTAASDAARMAAVSDFIVIAPLVMVLPGLAVGALGQMLKRRAPQTQ